MSNDRILIARIGAPHGVRGEVRLFVFGDDPEKLFDYAPLTDETGRRTFVVSSMREAKEHFVARIEGVATREAAEALTNTGIYIARDLLPATEDEDDFYHADLIGLTARLEDGTVFGKVAAVHDFGAGDILEIEPAVRGKTIMLPFTKAVVPKVDVAGGVIIVDPAEWAKEETPPPEADRG